MKEPMISCLTVARGKLPQVKASIRSYSEQTYAWRELLVIIEGSLTFRQALLDYIEALARPDIRVLAAETPSPDALYSSATGDLFCAWSSNDSSHPLRLELQKNYMEARGADVCFLADWIWFFWSERALYWYDGLRERDATLAPELARTLLAGRALFPSWLDHTRNGRKPADGLVAYLGCAGALLVTHGDAEPVRPAQASCKHASFIREHRATLRETLPGQRLSRPYLIHAPGTNGDTIVLDPFEEEPGYANVF